MNKFVGIDFDNTLVHVDKENNFELMPQVNEYLPRIYNLGFKLCLITGRKDYDRQFVENVINQIELLLNVKFEKIILTNDSQTKGNFAKDNNCSFMIDDKHSYLSDCVKNNVVPIYLNEKNKFIKSKKETVVYSWRQVYDYLKKMAS